MQYAIIDPNGVIINLVAYDGVSKFTPAGGTKLVKVNDWLHLGDNQNDPQPAPSPPPAPQPDPPPSVAAQLAALTAALINNNVLTTDQIDSATLDAVNATLESAGQSVIAVSAPIVSAKIGA